MEQQTDLGLSLAERQRRYAALRREMAERDIDVVVIVGRDGANSRADFRYVSSFGTVTPSPDYMVFPREEAEPVLCSRLPNRSPFASGWVKDTAWDWWQLPEKILQVVERFRGTGIVGVTPFDCFPVPLYLSLVERHGRDKVCSASDLFLKVRSIKSEEEIECARRAAKLADEVHAFLKGWLRPGCTDRDMFAQARRVMYQGGAEYSFDLMGIDLKGPGYAPLGRIVDQDSLVGMELTPAYLGYYNQIRLELSFGKAAARRRKAIDVLHEAYDTGVALIKPGTRCSDLYQATLEVIERHGFASGYGHFGHGLGLSATEAFEFDPYDHQELQAGMTFVFHPKIQPDDGYVLLLGGSYAVTSDGYEALNHAELF